VPISVAEKDDAQCQSYGATPGSPAYVNCRVTLAAQRDASSTAAFGNLLNAGLNTMAQQPRLVVPRSIDCTVEPNGPRVRSVSCW
jgi:hypothetical protein